MGGACARLPVLCVLNQPLLTAVIRDETGWTFQTQTVPADTSPMSANTHTTMAQRTHTHHCTAQQTHTTIQHSKHTDTHTTVQHSKHTDTHTTVQHSKHTLHCPAVYAQNTNHCSEVKHSTPLSGTLNTHIIVWWLSTTDQQKVKLSSGLTHILL